MPLDSLPKISEPSGWTVEQYESTQDYPRNRGYLWGRLSSVLRRDIQIERLQWLRTSRFDLACFTSLNDDEIAYCEVDQKDQQVYY